jgi:signal transduction histidine kinase
MLLRRASGPLCIRWLVAICSVFGLNCAWAQPSLTPAAGSELPALTTVQQVLDLGPVRARELRQRVRLRGTAALASVKPPWAFLHDGQACILIYGTNAPEDLAAGSVIEAEGFTESGMQSPLIERAKFTVIGSAPLPEPLRLPIARMAAGEGCWQYVRVEGVVRDMNRDAQNLAISIASEGRRFSAYVFGYAKIRANGLPVELLNARISLDAICWTDLDDRNQPLGFLLSTTATNTLRVLAPGNTNCFASPALRAEEIARLHQPSDERLKITGTVTAHLADDRVFLQTEFGSVQARLEPPYSRGAPNTETIPREPSPQLQPGDRIELLGAPVAGALAPLLLDARVRRVGNGPPPEPLPVNVSALAGGAHDADLVRCQARLLVHERRPHDLGFEELLVLEAGDRVFQAIWRTDSTNALAPVPFNASLQLDGICVVEPAPAKVRHTFRILLRRPADVKYLGQTAIWSRPVAGRMLGGGALLLAGAALWVWSLRRKVRQRTAELATTNASLSREVAERTRAQSGLARALHTERELSELKTRFVAIVSHEFRTPLGIIMSAVELLRNYGGRLPAGKREELHDDIYTSTRHMSGLMEQVLVLGRVEGGRLRYRPVPIELEQLCGKLTDESLSATNRRCRIVFRAEGELSGAQGDEILLRHIFSNLLSNGVKYSPPGAVVEFGVRRERDAAEFTVRDSGIGIPEADLPHLFEAFHRASNVGETPGTGLGLLIVKRCVELQSGDIEVKSKWGSGTTVVVKLPLFGAPG